MGDYKTSYTGVWVLICPNRMPIPVACVIFPSLIIYKLEFILGGSLFLVPVFTSFF